MLIRWIRLSAACVPFLAAAIAAEAAWIANGNPVSTAAGEQKAHLLVSDGAGGAIVAFWDSRSGSGTYDIYAQRIDRTGNAVWPGDVPICTAANHQYLRDMVSDGRGGAIMVWADKRTGVEDIYVQRIDGDGLVQWTTDGLPVCVQGNYQESARIASDGDGGAIVVWEDWRSGTSTQSDIYAQRIDKDGTVRWTLNGINVCTYATACVKIAPEITADGFGGAVIVWEDTRGFSLPVNYRTLKCQRIDAEGALLWNPIGESPNGNSGSSPIQRDAAILADETGGAFIVWRAFCGSCGNIYNLWGQRMNASGGRAWASIGNQICYLGSGTTRNDPVLAPDGGDGMIAAWWDTRNAATTGDDVYAQRVNFAGSMLWTANGILVCGASGNQQYPRIVRGEASAFITWADGRASTADIYIQEIDAAGGSLWQTNGLPVCVYTAEQHWPNLVLNSYGGAIVAWRDLRGGTYDIYAQSINRYGEYGQPSPAIASIEDIPDDEGGWVRLRVTPSAWDNAFEVHYPVVGYNVWRRVAPSPLSLATLSDRANAHVSAREALDRCAGGEFAAGRVLNAQQSSVLGLPAGEWESVGYHAAAPETAEYLLAAPTRADINGGPAPWDAYVVTAHTGNPINYSVSNVDSGYSVDNLAPAPPSGLAAIRLAGEGGLELSWDECEAPDLDHYAVYRGTHEAFAADPDCRIARSRDPICLDAGWRPGSGYCYRVSAVDVHGNEGENVLLSWREIDGFSPVPRAAFLAQNAPNPFNPSTSIGFGVAAPGRVELAIYDTAGRRVRLLFSGAKAAGYYTEKWDGRNDSGCAVSSGVYFCRLVAGSFVESRKMALIK